MPTFNDQGIHFTDPWLFEPRTILATQYYTSDSALSVTASSTTAFFTEQASRGLQDQTNWTANTYKTLLNVASGKGLVAGMCGPTAGGAETTTFEITVDGVLDELTITNATSERAFLTNCATGLNSIYTTAAHYLGNSTGALAASATTFQDDLNIYALPWQVIGFHGTPCLRFNTSLLIRAKHSENITNSTATSYSYVMYRLGL